MAIPQHHNLALGPVSQLHPPKKGGTLIPSDSNRGVDDQLGLQPGNADRNTCWYESLILFSMQFHICSKASGSSKLKAFRWGGMKQQILFP